MPSVNMGAVVGDLTVRSVASHESNRTWCTKSFYLAFVISGLVFPTFLMVFHLEFLEFHAILVPSGFRIVFMINRLFLMTSVSSLLLREMSVASKIVPKQICVYMYISISIIGLQISDC